MDSIQGIKKAVSEFLNDTNFLALRKRWQTDFALYRLKPYDAGKNYYSYTSNASRLLVDKAIEILNGAKLIIRIPDEVFALLDKNDREISSNVERFCYGSLSLNDERLVLKGFPPLREQLSWFLSLRGSVFIRALMNKDDDGNTIPEVDCFDPYNVAYGRGKKGIEWACHIYKTTKEQAENEFGNKVPQSEPTIYDFYDATYHRVIVENEWAKNIGEKGEEHRLKYCPIFEIKVGSMPSVSQTDYSYTNIHRGEGILAASRELYPLLNKTLSDLLTIVRRGVKVPLGIWSAKGDVTLDKDIWQVEQGAAVSFTDDVTVKPLIEQTMPADTAPLLQTITGEIQRAGFPYTTYGQLGFRLSGFAISQLSAAIETVVSAFIKAQKLAYETSCRQLLQQYTKKGFNPIKVFGRTSKGETFGMPEVLPIRPSELKGDWRLEVALEPILPKDDAQRYSLANLARQPGAFGDPLLADRTIRDMILGVQDPDLEQEIIDSEWAAVLPLVRLLRTYVAQLRQGDEIGAQATWLEIQRHLATAATQPRRGGGGGAPTGLEAEAMGTAGVGMPTGETGMSPETYPPEMGGGMPSGAMGAQMPLEGEI